MSAAILAAGRWLNDGPLPTRHPWRRIAGAAVVAVGAMAMLESAMLRLLQWAAGWMA
ncbi:MAG TPA: hypothetical protein VHA15_10070 [Burkholderiales bacterium]|nr:hypothetical protein [Burkholderiales bacterium]